MASPNHPFAGRTITLGVTGSIAAYKAVLVTRGLVKAGARVHVVLTAGAARFVGAPTFSGITGEPVDSDMFETAGERHVALAAESDLVLVVPATADALARFATGRADDLLTALVLCARCPVVVAPAMHPSMWSHPATARNVATLRKDRRVHFAGPVSGEVASGESGLGRMMEPEDVLAFAAKLLDKSRSTGAPALKDLAGKHLVVTAGPTVEDIDPVRFLGNRSSGKMGFAIAERAAARGARVTLVAGPVSLATPAGVTRVDTRSALDMQGALRRVMPQADALVMSAAVGDYRPATRLATKMKRGDRKDLSLLLKQNPDLLSEIGRGRSGSRPLLIGFAVETGTDEEIVERARRKLRDKQVDVVVANHADESMGRDDNRVHVVSERSAVVVGPAPKIGIADSLLDWVAERLENGRARDGSRPAGPGVERAVARRPVRARRPRRKRGSRKQGP